MTDESHDRWVTVTDAAYMLGKTERTIRRWVESGKIEVNRDVTPYEVNVGPFADELRTPAANRLKDRIEDLEAETERLRLENEHLKDRLEDTRGERDYLRNAHAMSLSNQQRLLESGAGRPWWRRLWPWGGKESD